MDLVPQIDPTSARLYGLVARTAQRAVIFRRGPSRQVRLLVWDLATDKIEGGQWFNGRIYERRCDLTPNGDALVYFAASYQQPFYSWTAISKPPFLTALALWPKGDCWGGGGLFESHQDLQLNHLFKDIKCLAPGFNIPSRLRVTTLGPYSGRGEDDPISWLRKIRDGWRHVADTHTLQRYIRDSDLVLRIHRHRSDNRIGRWYIETADLATKDGFVQFQFGQVDWADIDQKCNVLFARNGCLSRLAKRHMTSDCPTPHLVADLNAMRFTPIAPPGHARRWHEMGKR
jgi:hypothetical protein